MCLSEWAAHTSLSLSECAELHQCYYHTCYHGNRDEHLARGVREWAPVAGATQRRFVPAAAALARQRGSLRIMEPPRMVPRLLGGRRAVRKAQLACHLRHQALACKDSIERFWYLPQSGDTVARPCVPAAPPAAQLRRNTPAPQRYGTAHPAAPPRPQGAGAAGHPRACAAPAAARARRPCWPGRRRRPPPPLLY